MNWIDHPLFSWLQALRRELHMHPETAMTEVHTTARIKEILGRLGAEILPLDGLETGAAAVLRGARAGKTLALRADMDALSLDEANPAPYRSRNPGVMHACGHDAHTAILLGVVRQVVESGLMERSAGQVKFLFQPAEENLTGARAMIDAGALEDPAPDLILAAHMDTDLAVGQVGLNRGISHAASDRFTIQVQGKGGHAGTPQKTCDPVVAACHIVLALQSVVSRNLDPRDSGVISVGMIQAGSAFNIIPDTALVRGSIRSFQEETRQMMFQRIDAIARNIGKGLGVEAEVEIHEGVPPCESHPDASGVLQRAAAAVAGADNVLWLPARTGSEDFALFTQRIPGAMMRIGCRNEERGIIHPAHSPHFDLDETALPLGVEVFYRAIGDFLAGGPEQT